MHRFFLPASWLEGNEVTITGYQAHQIARVLRMRSGDTILVLDNSGWEIEVELAEVTPSQVVGAVIRRRLAQAEPRTKISLYQGVLKGNRFEFALQKGTELGIVEFVPLISDRCVMSDLEAGKGKSLRWERIIQEAAEQCRRGRKPALRPAVLFSNACEGIRQSGGLSLILWEEERQASLRELLQDRLQSRTPGSRPFSVNLFVGPEGGFTEAEIGLAQRYGLNPVGMGPRILRGETASMAAAAVILYELGDLG